MKRLIIYELKNMLGNFFGILFGLIFPIVMTYILLPAILKQTPDSEHQKVAIQLYTTNIMMVPLALMFIGFSALFSQELEKDVILRLSLFGISESKQMQAKIIVNALVTIGGMLLYTLLTVPFIDFIAPTAFTLIAFIISLLLLSVFLFLLSYGISLLARRFSVAYGITMSIFFLIMLLSGMMGLQLSDLPKFAQVIARYLPTTYIGSDFPKAWLQSSYNFTPLLQAFLAFGAISGLVCLAGLRYHRRRTT